MKKVKTHTFRLGTYNITETENGHHGCCELPTKSKNPNLEVSILGGNTKKALCTAIHEFMHAEGIPIRYLDHDNDDSAERIGIVLWRMGWRRSAKK